MDADKTHQGGHNHAGKKRDRNTGMTPAFKIKAQEDTKPDTQLNQTETLTGSDTNKANLLAVSPNVGDKSVINTYKNGYFK